MQNLFEDYDGRIHRLEGELVKTSDGRDVATYVTRQGVGASMEDAWKLPVHLEDHPNDAESHLYS